MNPTREIRTTAGLELKDAEKDSGFIGVIEGYAVKYDQDSQEFRTRGNPKPVVERIARGAFTRSLSEKKDNVAVVEHDMGKVFARQGVNLEITEDATGVFYRAKIPDTTVGRDLLTNVKLGIIKANSFEFELRRKDGKPAGVEWQQGDKQDRRIIREADFFHVSPVTDPAYTGTSLSVRGQRDALGAEDIDRAAEIPAASDSAPATQPNADRERRLRLLNLAPIVR